MARVQTNVMKATPAICYAILTLAQSISRSTPWNGLAKAPIIALASFTASRGQLISYSNEDTYVCYSPTYKIENLSGMQ